MRRFTSLTAAAAVVITSFGLAASPAEARHRHGGWGYRDRDRISAGDVIGGLLIIGTIAAIADAASKDKRRNRDERYDPPYRDDERRDVPRYDPEADEPAVPTGAYGGGEVEARAADACSWAVEEEMGGDARVDRVDGTERNGDGWYVTGTASRPDGDAQSFGCTVRNGRVVDVRFGR